MSIKKHSFGKTATGEEATLYTLLNKKGMSVSFYGFWSKYCKYYCS